MLTARWSLLRFASALGSAGRGGEIGAGSGDWGVRSRQIDDDGERDAVA